MASFDRIFMVSLSMMYLPRACSYSSGLSCIGTGKHLSSAAAGAPKQHQGAHTSWHAPSCSHLSLICPFHLLNVSPFHIPWPAHAAWLPGQSNEILPTGGKGEELTWKRSFCMRVWYRTSTSPATFARSSISSHSMPRPVKNSLMSACTTRAGIYTHPHECRFKAECVGLTG